MEKRKLTPFVSSNVNQVAKRDAGFGESVSATYGYNYGPIKRFGLELLEFGADEYDNAYNWEKDIAGYEEDVEFLSVAKNPEHMQFLKESLNINKANRDTMDRGSFFGIMTASIVDPLNIAFAMPVFNTALKAAWASKSAFGVAKESGKIGFAFGVAQEGLRAPFDPLATPTEVGTNIISSTVGSALLVGGLRGAGNLLQPRVKKGLDELNDYAYGVGKVPNNYNGVPIVKTNTTATPTVKVDTSGTEQAIKNIEDRIKEIKRLNVRDIGTQQDQFGRVAEYKSLTDDLKKFRKILKDAKEGKPVLKQKLNTRNDGTKVGARFNKADNKIYWDENFLKSQFPDKPWTKPKIKGVRALPENAFNTPDDWARFVLQHEMTHVDNSFVAMQTAHKQKYGQGTTYTKADYENDINNIALEKHYKGFGLKQTAATKSWLYNLMSTPSKRSMNDMSLPNEIHQNIVKSFHNGAENLEGSLAGKGIQSLAARALTYSADAFNLERDLKLLWREEIKGFQGGGEVLGFNVDNLRVRTGTYGQNAKTYEEWLQNTIDLVIDSFDPTFSKTTLANLPKTSTEGMERLKNFFKNFEADAREVGALGDDASLRIKLKDYKEQIAFREDEIAALTASDPVANKSTINTSKIVLDYQKKEAIYLQGLLDNSVNRNYAFPIYYNKVLLKESPQALEELTIIFKDHMLSQGKHNTWDNVSGTWSTMRVSEEQEARSIAEQIVTRIIEDPDVQNLVPKSGKGKHLMRRALDIPEYKIKDYMVRDSRVIQNYANKMGFRLEWARMHGKMDIDDILMRHEELMRRDGKHTEDRIAEVKRDFLADYEREAGIHVRDPDAMNQTVVRNLKSIAGMTYLPLAGITSIIDATAMPIFEHGFKNVFKTGLRLVDGDWANMKMNGRQVRNSGEGLEISRPIVQYRVLTDSVRDLQPKRTERIIQTAERAFYMANILSPITAGGKHLDAMITIPEFYHRITTIKNNGKISQFEIGELARYGITELLAKRLANMPWGKTDSGMPVLDLEAWPSVTFQDRELKRTMSTYIAQHARNTIMHSTSGDRPMIVDGFMYLKWKPWMSSLGMKIDERASTATVKFARVENAVMSIPFQFLNFAFAANNRIMAASLDPARQHRLSGVIALFGMSYLTLKLKKDDWWFEDKGIAEIMMRTLDQSGITGLYSDIAYHALHTAIATGVHNPDQSWLKGKYKPTVGEDSFDKLGAVPAMLSEWVMGANEMLTGNTAEGFRDTTYHVPVLGLFGLSDDIRAMTRQ